MIIPDTGTDSVCPGSFFAGGTYPVTKGERGHGNTAKSNGPRVIYTGRAGSRSGGQFADDICDLPPWRLDDRVGTDIPTGNWILFDCGATGIGHIREHNSMEKDPPKKVVGMCSQRGGVFHDSDAHYIALLRWGIQGDGGHVYHSTDGSSRFGFGD